MKPGVGDGRRDKAREAEVCILLPTWNDAGYLSDTIRSALAQSFEDFRLVILDNASTDHTAEVVAAFDDPRIEYRQNDENIGFLGNLNLGFSLISGRFVVVMNSDDQMEPTFLERCVAVLRADAGASMVHTASRWIDAEGAAFGASQDGWPPVVDSDKAFFLTLKTGFTFAAVMFRAAPLAEVTPLRDPAFARIADTELFLRMCLKGRVHYINEVLCLYRVHDQSMSLKMYGNGEFFRIHLLSAKRAFAWPEAQAAGLDRYRRAGLRAVAMQSLSMLHVGRETGGTGKLFLVFLEVVREVPGVLLTPKAWMRLGLGLLPLAVIRRLRSWRRRRGARAYRSNSPRV